MMSHDCGGELAEHHLSVSTVVFVHEECAPASVIASETDMGTCCEACAMLRQQ